MRETRTGITLGLAALLAGIGPFLTSAPEVRHLCAASAFCLPATVPFFFRDRSLGFSAGVFLLGFVVFGSVSGVFVMDAMALRRTLLVRNIQMASAGALTAGFLVAIAWARDLLRNADQA
jgi:hypothetical protein